MLLLIVTVLFPVVPNGNLPWFTCFAMVSIVQYLVFVTWLLCYHGYQHSAFHCFISFFTSDWARPHSSTLGVPISHSSTLHPSPSSLSTSPHSPSSPLSSCNPPSLSSSLTRRIQRSRSTSLENPSELYRKVLKPLDQVRDELVKDH